jgi:predicted double-glycine peptidase
LAAAASRGQLAAVSTRIDGDGVCLQSTEYTCGPASAVTVLRRLGLTAEEGELALLARSSKVTGTPADVLATMLNERFGRDGIEAQYREFGSLDELGKAGLTMVVIKYGLLMDHWLTVLDINDRELVVANPLTGVERMPRGQFLAKWRHVGVVVKRAG